MSKLQLIAVDIGNSLTKVGWFDEVGGCSPLAPRADIVSRSETTLPQPTAVRRFPTGQPPPDEWFADLPSSVRWRVTSVNREGQRILTETVRSRRPQDDLRILDAGDMPIAVRVD